MKTIWTQVTDKQEEQDIRASFAGSLVLRKRLIKILEGKIEAYENASMSKDGYDCPNWAYKQADLQGYKRALKEVISLLE